MDRADKTLHEMANMIEEETLPVTLEESWAEASDSFEAVSRIWMDHKRAYILFTNSEAVAEAEYTFHRVRAFLAAEDKANASGELAYLRRQLLFLHEYEILSLENII